MVSVRRATDAWHALVFLLVYGFVATAIAPGFGPYPRVLAALVVSVVVFAAWISCRRWPGESDRSLTRTAASTPSVA
jgi:hypothetical protein